MTDQQADKIVTLLQEIVDLLAAQPDADELPRVKAHEDPLPPVRRPHAA